MTIELVKACGIGSIEEAELCIKEGVSYIGILVGLTHKA